MLDEPHNVRLNTRRAIPGSYNLKDPPRSPNLSYPGPRWVPDSLCAAWCAAETLLCCLPPGIPVTYEAAHRMLELVLPDQRERWEIGIELMLLDGRFAPEQMLVNACSSNVSNLSRQDPQCSHKSLRQASRSASSLQNTIDEIVKGHTTLMNKLAKESEEFQKEMRKTAFPDPAPAPCHSDSALETTPRVRKLSQELQNKAVSSKTGNQLERVRDTRPYPGSSHVELEKHSKAPHEWVESPLPSAKPAMHAIV
ncbi:hypothetical protein AX14_011636 [Amanita brunnescens Koide BX004]|nr:hypothetical protein AX14_011636 [Amanita brunnescens Koide BX004]